MRHRYLTCPTCGARTAWSSAQPTATNEDEKRADEAIAAVAELDRDIAHLEDLAMHSDRLLSFGWAFGHWPLSSAASDAASLDFGAEA